MFLSKRGKLSFELAITVAFVLINIGSSQAQQEDPTVDTEYGTVRGKSITLEDGSVIDTYLGIPYATPPVGDLRFTLSTPTEPWDDVFDATEPGRACVQYYYRLTNNEDCLHVNIYTPQNKTGLLPVIAYIHGGDFQIGANFESPGYFLSRNGVVMVNINYRLGILGYAYTGDGVIPGNMGLMDMVLALEFIQRNIEAFGGDPGQVTIFGESSGAASVGHLLMTPYSEGLFHGAILQSGCELEYWGTHSPEMNPQNFVADVAVQFNCTTDSTQAMVDCLREANAYDLMQAYFTCPPGYESECNGFRTVIDGDIIPDYYMNLRERGEYMHVREMIGMNENDGFNALGWTPGVIEEGLTREQFNAYLLTRALYVDQKWPNATVPRDVAEAFKFFYADWPYYEDPERNRNMVGKMYTDEWYGYPADLQAKMHNADGNDVYYYVYDYVPLVYDDYYPDWVGTIHGVDHYEVFGWPFLLMPENQEAYEHSQTRFTGNVTVEDQEFSNYMMTLWTNFAKFGNPTPVPVEDPDGVYITWDAFTTSQLNVMNLKRQSRQIQDYRQDYYAFWREYLRYLVYDEDVGDDIGIGVSGFNSVKTLQDILET